MEIKNLAVDNVNQGLVTDNPHPVVTFYIESSAPNTSLKEATITCNGFSRKIRAIGPAAYRGESLLPYTTYEVVVEAEDTNGEKDKKTISFETGKMRDEWKGRWISDASYAFKEKSISPKHSGVRMIPAASWPRKQEEIGSAFSPVFIINTPA